MNSSSEKYAQWVFRRCLVLALGLGVAFGQPWAAVQAQTPAQQGSGAAVPGKAPVARADAGKDTEKKPAQQERMKNCNAEAKAKTLKGDERKAFMSQCLSNKPAEKAQKK